MTRKNGEQGAFLPVAPSTKHGITVLIGSPTHEPILELVVQLALMGDVTVFGEPEQFDWAMVTRIVQRQTTALAEVTARIVVKRPYSPTQLLRLLKNTRSAAPLVLIDLLAIFEQMEADTEKLVGCLMELGRIGGETAVLITISQPSATVQGDLVALLCDKADYIHRYEG